MKHRTSKNKGDRIVIAVFVAMLFTVLYCNNIGMHAANTIADRLYQHGGATSGNIFLLEIDAHSLEELGPYQTWTRDYVADAIQLLNRDSESAPAAIGVDVLYIGETTEESDQHLVNACAQQDNVVVGSLLNLDQMLTENADGSYSMESGVALYEEPFSALANVTEQGFVNGFSDSDGVVRHGLQEMTLEDGRKIPSFSYAVYEKYADKNELTDRVMMPQNREGYWYLNYQSESGGYSNGYSLSDFIQGEIPTERFADAIVLIGPYAEGLMDSYHTAVDATSPMYGVEIHANMIDAMLNQDQKTEVSRGIQACILFLAVMVICILCQKDKLRYAVMAGIAGCIGYPLVAYLLYQQGLVLSVCYIPIAAFVIPVVTIAVHYIRALSEKRKVEQTFKRYVDPEVVDKIMKTGMDEIQLGGATVDIACLFVDIRGFTTMSEALEPEQVVQILNQYLNLTSSCIFKHHGTLDKFIGDATMALFNAPLPQEDYVYEAVMTAVDMVKGAKVLGAKLQEQYGRTVNFGVGVHCGKAVVGNIGTDKRMDYTAIGDTVNTAARLEANAPAGTVLISKDVYEVLKDRIQAESIGAIPLKGKSAELEIFKVIVEDER